MNVTENGNKKSRIHCSISGCCQRDSAEHEGYDRALTVGRVTENNKTDADSRAKGLLEQILELDNLDKAYKQVKKKGFTRSRWSGSRASSTVFRRH